MIFLPIVAVPALKMSAPSPEEAPFPEKIEVVKVMMPELKIAPPQQSI